MTAGRRWRRVEQADESTLPPLTASSPEELMVLLRAIKKWSGRTAAKIAAFTDLPRSTAYHLADPKIVSLPRSQHTVEEFCRGCGLSRQKTDQVTAIWRKLHDPIDDQVTDYVIDAEVVAEPPGRTLEVREAMLRPTVIRAATPPVVVASGPADQLTVNRHSELTANRHSETNSSIQISDVQGNVTINFSPRDDDPIDPLSFLDVDERRMLSDIARSHNLTPRDTVGMLIRQAYSAHRATRPRGGPSMSGVRVG